MSLKLYEGEYKFMSLIWDNEPVASGDLVKLCREAFGWKKSTTYTVLKKMNLRGFTENKDYVIRSLVSRDQAQKYASEQFVEQTFNGSLPGFLVAFLNEKKLSQKDVEELKKLIDEHEE